MDNLPILDSLIMYALAIAISACAAVIIQAIVVLTARVGVQAAKPAAQPTAAAARPAATPAGIPEDHVAAITAAVAATLGGHRVVHIADESSGAMWRAEGRLRHQTSHQPH